MSRLLAYTIGGQKIGIDIKSWNASTLGGNPAFMIFADTGTLPTNYTNISSVDNWDNFGSAAGQTESFIKSEIIKLIPGSPTSAQYAVLEKYMNVGINGMSKIGSTTMFGNVITGTTTLTGTTDSIVYGTEYQLFTATASTTSSATSSVPKIATLFNIAKAGTYKITANWVWSRSATNSFAYFNVDVDAVILGVRGTLQMRVPSANDIIATTRTYYKYLTAGQHTIDLNWWNSGGSTTMSDAMIEIIRVK